jgi:ABC-type sugar transport system ATPase subunit
MNERGARPLCGAPHLSLLFCPPVLQNMKNVIYSVQGIRKSFGPTVALDGVNFDVREGAIVGLVGTNGAGKSTLMRVIAGAVAPDAGGLFIDGRKISLGSTLDALNEGVAIVSQELSLFPSLTIEENLRFVQGKQKWRSKSAFRKSASETLKQLGAVFELTDRVARLGLADRQVIEIARALLQRPRVLILDEPTSALHAAEVGRLHTQLRRLRDSGVGIVYVSHFLEDLLDVCDEITVLRNGRCVECPDLTKADRLPRLVAAMLGDPPASSAVKTVDEAAAVSDQSTTTAPLMISGLKGPKRLDIEELSAKPGEIVGLAGLVGSGVEELFAVLFGLQSSRAGTVRLPSGRALPETPADAVRAGIAYVPPDRKTMGLMLRQTIGENVVSVRTLAQGRDGFVLDRVGLARAASKRCAELGVRMSSIQQIVGALSGGNQQKVVFAKWLEANPSLLLLDDSTRGIDIGARQEIHNIIRRLNRLGLVILFYSSDPAEIVQIADRISVFVDGVIIGELSGEQKTEHNVITLMNSSADCPPVFSVGLPKS